MEGSRISANDEDTTERFEAESSIAYVEIRLPPADTMTGTTGRKQVSPPDAAASQEVSFGGDADTVAAGPAG